MQSAFDEVASTPSSAQWKNFVFTAKFPSLSKFFLCVVELKKFLLVSMFFFFFISRLLLKLTKKEEEVKKKEITLDMLQPSRYKPNDLEQMAEDTKFTKRKPF